MEIIPTTIEHILCMNENVSLEDFKEFLMYKKYVAKNEEPTLLEYLIEASSHYDVHTMIHDGVVMAIGGELNGCVWFLTTNFLGQSNKKIKREFIDVMNEHKERVLDETGYIWNYIWEGNKQHIKFITMMGAKFPDVEDTPEQFKFFIIRR